MFTKQAHEFLNETPHVDRATIEMLLSHCNGDKTIIHEIFGAFYPDADQLVAEILLAQANIQEDNLRRAAHSLSGVAGSVGALKLKEVSRIIENSLKKGDKQIAFDLADLVGGIYEEFKISIKDYL